ncbi:hypothetical protein TI04_03895 [Achromatium sp. WMS2]|nr:hypothetical protein TI04_03895 [Achromatium sp. WMS2]
MKKFLAFIILLLLSMPLLYFGIHYQNPLPSGSKGIGDEVPVFQAATTPGRKLALLVGVKNYAPNTDVMPLKYADQDMQRLQKVLEQHGYAVQLLLNEQATKNGVLSALNTFGAALGHEPTNSTVLFAFSGHGFAEQDKNFLLTYDTYRNAVADTALPVDEVVNRLNASKAQHKLIWIDACRTQKDKTGNIPGFRPQDASGLMVLFSSAVGSPSYEDDELQAGIFSHYLLKGLTGAGGQTTDQDGWIRMEQLRDYVEEQVIKRSFDIGKSQHPYLAGEYSSKFWLGRVKVASLTLDTQPKGAQIKLLNQPWPYKPGMSLPLGSYPIEVSARGYRNLAQTIELRQDVTLPLALQPQAIPAVVQRGHTSSVESVAFSPDGTILASASADNTIKLWRVADGALLRTLTGGHTGWVNSVAFSPDGNSSSS